MTPTKLSAKLSIGPEPTADDLAALAAAGFRSVINNRTDKEGKLRLDSNEMALAVEGYGMDYVHIPVEGRNPLERDALAFEDALEEKPGPDLCLLQDRRPVGGIVGACVGGKHRYRRADYQMRRGRPRRLGP